MRKVLILKTESESCEKYARFLAEYDFQAVFVSTLTFRFKNLNVLKDKLISPEKYRGIVFTSLRCVDAVRNSMHGETLPVKWNRLHNYCVGESTNNYVKSSFVDLNTYGEETGNASSLADYINSQEKGSKCLPFLFPCGNLCSNALTGKLIDAGYSVDTCVVYETIPHPNLFENLNAALTTEIDYITFFSPSGVKCCYEYFTRNNTRLANKRLIAIGPSTRKSMEGIGLTVYRTAEKPSVEGLIEVLLS